jgi:hypothetical protein
MLTKIEENLRLSNISCIYSCMIVNWLTPVPPLGRARSNFPDGSRGSSECDLQWRTVEELKQVRVYFLAVVTHGIGVD